MSFKYFFSLGILYDYRAAFHLVYGSIPTAGLRYFKLVTLCDLWL